MPRLLLTTAFSFFVFAAHANGWTASPVKNGSVPTSESVSDRVNGEPESPIRSAVYRNPVNRYGHEIMGSTPETATLSIVARDADGGDENAIEFELPENQVFEDRNPRLTDLSGFGEAHIATIVSDVSKGASIAVFGFEKDALKLLAQTPYSVTPKRWRNIAGIADFDGDGSIQIAEVVTPHIGGTLRFWTWKKGKLIPSGELNGFSNHAIGSRELRLSAVEDFDGDGVEDIALPNADRKALRLIKFSGKANGNKTLEEIANVPLPARIDKAITAKFDGSSVVITVGLEDGSVYAIHQ